MAETKSSKVCNKCGEQKPREVFGIDKHKADGLRGYCKLCRAQQVRDAAYRWRTKNPEKFRTLVTSWRNRNKDKKRQSTRRWERENYERLKACKRAWSYANKDSLRASNSRWKRKHPEYGAAQSRNRKARLAGAGGKHGVNDIRALFTLQVGKCAVCRVKLDKYHVDHVMPLKRGGSNDRDNLQLLCPTCNMCKGAKHPVSFMQERGFLL